MQPRRTATRAGHITRNVFRLGGYWRRCFVRHCADSVAVITRRCQRLNSGSNPDRRTYLPARKTFRSSTCTTRNDTGTKRLQWFSLFSNSASCRSRYSLIAFAATSPMAAKLAPSSCVSVLAQVNERKAHSISSKMGHAGARGCEVEECIPQPRP